MEMEFKDIFKNTVIATLILIIIILMYAMSIVQDNDPTLGNVSSYECTQTEAIKGRAICTTLELKEE